MSNWTTIISFTYPHEAHLVKAILESEGIKVVMKDELTVQVNNFYSNAIGGVKLMVKDSDYAYAYQVLSESGFIKEKGKKPNEFLMRLDHLTSKLPFIGKSIIELRLLVFVALTLTIIIVPIALLSLPSTLEKLTKNSWCVDKIYYKGRELTTNSTGTGLETVYENCFETMNFSKDGDFEFPGINSNGARVRWKLKHDSLMITAWSIDNNAAMGEHLQTDKKEVTVNNILYPGTYSLKIKNDIIKMQSDSVTILGKIYRFNDEL